MLDACLVGVVDKESGVMTFSLFTFASFEKALSILEISDCENNCFFGDEIDDYSVDVVDVNVLHKSKQFGEA